MSSPGAACAAVLAVGLAMMALRRNRRRARAAAGYDARKAPTTAGFEFSAGSVSVLGIGAAAAMDAHLPLVGRDVVTSALRPEGSLC